MKKSVPVLGALFVCMVFCFGGCSQSKSASQNPTSPGITTPVGQYPVQTNTTLSYWLELHANISPNFPNIGQSPFGKGLQEHTGIKVNFLHPPIGANASREQLNLMIADGTNLPDIIEWRWTSPSMFPGGPQKAINDGVIIKLNDIIDKYCPHFKAFLKANPEFDRMVKTDDGSYYAFPFIRGAEKLLYSQGLYIRKDWLEELNLPIPDTIDEWRMVLTGFKEQKNTPAPFTMVYTNNAKMFVDSFGIMKDFYISADDGKVHYGQIETGYRRWLETMAQWYREGLIDPDIASIQTSQMNQKMTTGQSGAAVGSIGSGMGNWTAAARGVNPDYELIALPFPVEKKGDKRIYSSGAGQYYSGQNSAAISGSSKNVEIAARFLDWGYSPEGHRYYNFGNQGEAYTMDNDYPVYTDMIKNNPQGWSFAQSLAAYARGNMAGPFVQDERYIEQYYALPEQAQALVSFVVPGATNYVLPSVTATPEESRELARISNDVNTYAEEMITKFILGTEAINDQTWNTFVNNIKRLEIDRALEIQNASLERYKNR
ncbi:MAG: extracellular solute-binding protein [Treponema sp.]|nr:extracellular solute-binding protein [Treponema sp.]